ncbi:MAG: IS1595 family transposase [Longimicrobiales bacterium]|nr:IS1595 family transposase [Longimicrobiales bacterium]
MEDYPRTLRELESRFATEPACRDYLARLRWPQGFACPACKGTEAWSTGRGLWMCAACGHQVSVTAGTIFQDTRTPLTLWFRAIWWVVSQKTGASALGLQQILGLGSYRTAWTWLHKLRRAMVRPGRDPLSERVEVDETFVGGVETGGGRRHIGKKALVAIAAEVRGRAIGRIRMQRVADSSAESLLPFVQEAVRPGTIVITDGLQSYRGLPDLGYRHDRRVLLGSGESAEAVLPRVHQIASLLKRWLLGTHQGAVSREHLDYYLDEFTFRFNRRTSRHRGKLFYRLLEQAVTLDPVPYAAMVKGVRGPKKKRHHNG